jgi:predicted metal-dependent peptidase
MQTPQDKALDAAKINLICRPDSTFITTILFSLNFDWCSKRPTASTNGFDLLINPDFFMGLTKGQRVFLLAHEAWHVAFQHMVRVRKDMDFRTWNMACDYVINLMLVNSGFEFIPEGLLDKQYADLSSDTVYAMLTKVPKTELPEFDEDMEEFDGTAEDIVTMEEQIQDVVMQAAIKAKMDDQAGTIPGEIQIQIDKLLTPKLPWHTILARVLNSMSKNDYSLTKPNKRYLPDYYLPSLYSESVGDIAVAVDISGSITKEEFRQFISEIASIHKSMQPDKTEVISFDTQISDIYTINQMEDILGLKFKGGGGTCITPVYEWAKEHKPKALIIFTDGYFHINESQIPKNTEVFWIISNNSNFKVKRGKVIHFE